MKERQNADLIQNQKGFVFYRIHSDECYIVEMFIDEPYRGGPAFKELIETLELIAKDCQCKYMSANIYLNDPGCNRSLSAALKVGFKLHQANNNILLIVKEI